MLYFKILMLTAATIATLAVFAESDKDSKRRYARVLYGFLYCICLPSASRRRRIICFENISRRSRK